MFVYGFCNKLTMKNVLKSVLFAIYLVSSACALTPQEVVDTGYRYSFESNLEPKEAALCISRAAENENTIFQPFIRELDNNGAVELIVKIISGSSTTIVVGHFFPITSGSKAKMWITNQPLYISKERLYDILISGCAPRM